MKREIAKLVTDGLYREAMSLYSQLHSASVHPHRFPFSSLLKSCGKLNSLPQGQMVHSHIIKTGSCSDVYAATALTDMYMKLHILDDALKVFDEMPERNTASLNAVISGLSRNGRCREAFDVFKDLLFQSYTPNSVTLASLCSACERVEHLVQIHCWAVKLGVEMDVFVASSVVTMYSKYSQLVSSRKVFEEMPNKSVVSYNAFVTGLLQNGATHVVLDVFKDMMQCSGEEPNTVSLVLVLSACASLSNLQFGMQVHGLAIKMNMGFDTMVGNALVNMYSKCGSCGCAYDVFKELDQNRDIVTWNSMIAGMVSNGEMENAVKLFEQLEDEGFKPDSVTWNSMIFGFSQQGKAVEAIEFFRKMQASGTDPSLKSITSLLPACSDLSALHLGKEIHGFTIRTLITIDEFVATGLVDLYMKCGHFSWARKVFDQFQMKTHDPALWNAMISGYGRNGETESAFEIFRNMQNKFDPNSATFVALLSACSHSGEVDKGYEIFITMKQRFGINPEPKHYSCIVDLLGRAGRLDKAREVIGEMAQPCASVFASLLGACRCYSDHELGEEMAVKLLELNVDDPAPFVVLSNIYADKGMWKDVERIREMIKDKGSRKLPGFSAV